ncbi:MAG: hypothetical protein LBL28_06225 [Treponema sp.]|nr:hypothetical protein [Treponema sp.]
MENKYPSDLNIPGVGTLKYMRTLWDQNDIYNNGDDEIYDAVKIEDQIWIFSQSYYGDTLFKGINKSASVTIQYPKKGDFSFRYTVWHQRILMKGKYFIFFISNDTTYYEDGKWLYYIARVDMTSMDRQYIKLPSVTGDQILPIIYNFNNEVVFHYNYDPANYANALDSYYKLNENCDDLIEITEYEFENLNIPEQNIVIDNNGKHYRIYHGSIFEVSVDNGTTWYKMDMGTNHPKSVLIVDDYIYVFCGQYHKLFDVFHSEYVGGGIHIFKWEL